MTDQESTNYHAMNGNTVLTQPDHRIRRAREEAMEVSLVRRGGIYEVHSASGNLYEVDIGMGTCSCLDWQNHEPDGGCKHVRRVDMEIKNGRVPRPDGRLPEKTVSGTDTEGGPASPTSAVATDGGALANTDDRFATCMSRIDNRVRDLELEIDQRRAELKDLDCALSVIEEFLPDDCGNADINVDTDTRGARPLHDAPSGLNGSSESFV